MNLTVGQAQPTDNISAVGTLDNMKPTTPAAAATPPPTTTPQVSGASSSALDPKVVRLAQAIRQQESNHNPNAVGDSGHSIGAYQWYDKNGNGMAHFKADATSFGLDPNDFSLENQNKVAYSKMKKLKDEGRGPDEIAAIWNGAHLVGNKYVANNPDYVKSVHAIYEQTPEFNPAPFGSGDGQIDLSNPDAIVGKNLKDTSKNVVVKTGKGLLNAGGNFLTGVVKGTGQIYNGVSKTISNPINNFIFGKDQTEYGNQFSDNTFRPKGTSQKVGAFVGRDVLPATAALTTGGAGLEALSPGLVSETLPAMAQDITTKAGSITGPARGLIGKAIRAFGYYEALKHSPAKGILKIIGDL